MKAAPLSIWSNLAICLVFSLCACTPISLALLSAGTGAGISHQMDGFATRTFTAPLPRVRAAAVLALKRMDIRMEGVEKTETGEILRARAADRQIEVEIEAVTRTITRVQAVARKDLLLVDAAMAAEIITQTGKAMGT